MYESPRTILQQKLKETLSTTESSVVSDLIKLSLLRSAEKDSNLLVFSEIYKLFGPEQFAELISAVDGKTLTFPSKQEFKDVITTVLCYYYRSVEGKEWEEIKQLMGDPDLNTIKFGIRATSFGSFLDTMMQRLNK